MNFYLSFFTLKYIALLMILLPTMGFVGLSLWAFGGLPWREIWIERLTRSLMLLLGLGSLALVWGGGGSSGLPFHYGYLINLPNTQVGFNLRLDSLALTYLVTSGFIAAIVGYFSARYLHRDPGYFRFFTLYLLFVAGLNLTSLAGGLLAFIAGWEFIGLSSVLLVGFYRERSGPQKGAQFVFGAYRIGDLGIHGLAMLLPLWLGSDLFPQAGDGALASNFQYAYTASVLILWAAACKSAQGPFSVWLPKAMEGPTPSSAIFYGALSVHLGVLLLLKTAPIWRMVDFMTWLIGVLGFSTAFYGASVGRTRSDIKSLLAYASMAQVGLIFLEVAIGLDGLALWHMVGHSMLRTLQFLRAPSAISDWMRFGKLQGWRKEKQRPIEVRLGRTLEVRLYKAAFQGWGLELLIKKLALDPILKTAERFNSWLQIWGRKLDGSVENPQIIQSRIDSSENITAKDDFFEGHSGAGEFSK